MGARTLLTAVALLLAGPALAHSWYDYACCSERDCRLENITTAGITIEHEVNRRIGGWFVTSTNELIPFDDKRIKISLDTGTHLCLMPSGVKGIFKVRCLYLPEAAG